MIKIIIVLTILIIVMFLIIKFLWLKNKDLKSKLDTVIGRKQSISTKYGKMTENFMPFLSEYPYNPNQFRFIGHPIDGIQFENDKIILMEFKTADSKLTKKQKEIKNLIEDKKVYFEEFRI